MTVAAKLPVASRAARHLCLVLTVVWSVFVYRDVWPSMTFDLEPIDGAEGWLIWTKIGVLSFSGVVVPLLIPRQYIPFDPKVRAALFGAN